MKKIAKWITAYGGATKLARELGVSKEIVYHWIHGRNVPRAENIKRMMKLSDGHLFISDFYDNLVPPTSDADVLKALTKMAEDSKVKSET